MKTSNNDGGAIVVGSERKKGTKCKITIKRIENRSSPYGFISKRRRDLIKKAHKLPVPLNLISPASKSLPYINLGRSCAYALDKYIPPHIIYPTGKPYLYINRCYSDNPSAFDHNILPMHTGPRPSLTDLTRKFSELNAGLADSKKMKDWTYASQPNSLVDLTRKFSELNTELADSTKTKETPEQEIDEIKLDAVMETISLVEFLIDMDDFFFE